MKGFRLFIDGESLDAVPVAELEAPEAPGAPGVVELKLELLVPTSRLRQFINSLWLAFTPPRLTRARTPIRQLLWWRCRR